MDDLKFIKKFNKITVSAISKRLKINQYNLYNNRTKKEKISQVKNEIIKEVENLIKEDKEEE